MGAVLLLCSLLAVSCHAPNLKPTKPLPVKLQAMAVRDGVLRFADNGEVNLWGVNFQPSLSWEYSARMEQFGLFTPLEADEMKRMTDASFDQIQRLGCNVIRIHLCPGDFVDSKGMLVDRIWLDLLDYTLAQARKRGIYVSLTLINNLKGGGKQAPAFNDSFANKYPPVEWLVVPEVIQAGQQYTRALLNRINPYDQTQYKNNPAIVLIEPVNEPTYLTRQKLDQSPSIKKVYQDWLLASDRKDDMMNFTVFRYETTLSYINGMAGVIRAEGAKQPLIWNCEWPRNIQNNEEIYQAIADSKVEAISFCLYPGQDDAGEDYWKNPKNLSSTNYLPYLQNVSNKPDWFGWIRSPRFAAKAKVVYEYETFFNQSAYLYPAMAKEFRSLGAQVATQWTYSLSGYETYAGGSHVLNLEATPRKAASFMIAHEVFKALPRDVPYNTTTPDSDRFDGVHLSQPLDISAIARGNTLIHAGSIPDGFVTLPDDPRSIIGVGDSPFITYAGTGIHFLEQTSKKQYHLTILPSVNLLAPQWHEAFRGKPNVELDRVTAFPFRLQLPGNRTITQVERQVGKAWQSVTFDDNQFLAVPGDYRITLK